MELKSIHFVILTSFYRKYEYFILMYPYYNRFEILLLFLFYFTFHFMAFDFPLSPTLFRLFLQMRSIPPLACANKTFPIQFYLTIHMIYRLTHTYKPMTYSCSYYIRMIVANKYSITTNVNGKFFYFFCCLTD